MLIIFYILFCYSVWQTGICLMMGQRIVDAFLTHSYFQTVHNILKELGSQSASTISDRRFIILDGLVFMLHLMEYGCLTALTLYDFFIKILFYLVVVLMDSKKFNVDVRVPHTSLYLSTTFKGFGCSYP